MKIEPTAMTWKEQKAIRARLRLMENAVRWYSGVHVGVRRPKPVLKAEAALISALNNTEQKGSNA